MKRKQLFVVALVAVLSTLSFSAKALTESEAKAVRASVADVRLPELGARAASIVTQANATDREAVAVTAVKAIVAKHPATAPVVVGSISKAAPETSPAVAAAAAVLSPEQVTAIVKAAVAAAPKQADKIAAAVAKVQPKSALKIANTAMNVAPLFSAQIVAAVDSVVPGSKAQLPRVRQTADARAVVTNPFGGNVNTGNQQNLGKHDEANVQEGKDSDRDTYGIPK